MPEPVSIAASVFSGFNAFVKAISLAAHYKEVPKEVKQLHTNIERAESAINIAKRLLRSKAHYVDPRLSRETRQSIEATENVLLLVRESIEGCRKDLEIQETVTFKNRATWLLWKNQEFLSQLQTLGNCLDALDRDILRLEMVHPPIIVVDGSLAPPEYEVGEQDEDKKSGQDVQRALSRGGEKPPFPRSPTKRLRSCNNSSSQINLNQSTETTRARADSWATMEDDASCRSDGLSERRESDRRGNFNPRDARRESDHFDLTPFELEAIGPALLVSHPSLNSSQVRFSQANQDPALSTTRRTPDLVISELPGSLFEGRTLDTQPCIQGPYASNNPWRKKHINSALPNHIDVPAVPRGQTSASIAGTDDTNWTTTTTTTSPTGDNGEDIATTLLGIWATAPAAPSDDSRPDNELLAPEAREKKVRWRRKSDFI